MAQPADPARLLAFIREETRFEIELLHARANALIAAEAFLTIAYATTMANGNARWGPLLAELVAPVLAATGLVLAGLAAPGIGASFRIVRAWDARQGDVMGAHPELVESLWRPAAGRGGDPDQRRSLMFARAVPAVFVAAWSVLLAVALALPRLP